MCACVCESSVCMTVHMCVYDCVCVVCASVCVCEQCVYDCAHVCVCVCVCVREREREHGLELPACCELEQSHLLQHTYSCKIRGILLKLAGAAIRSTMHE